MITKPIAGALKSDGTKVPAEPGLGCKLAASSTYYFDVSVPDGALSSVQVIWDATITAVVNFQDSNAPPYKGHPASDPDNGVDVALNDNNGNCVVTEDPSIARIFQADRHRRVANFTLTITAHYQQHDVQHRQFRRASACA